MSAWRHSRPRPTLSRADGRCSASAGSFVFCAEFRVSKTDAVRFAARQGIFPVESGPCQRHCVDTAAYGPEHAYTSKRVSTIETRIDPPIPIVFEKNTNILQANSARLRSFRH